MAINKEQHRKIRHKKVRVKISGTALKPRLSVFRSNAAIYAQLIDDTKMIVITSSSSLKSSKSKGIESAKEVGLNIARFAKEKNISSCVFDRGGYLYHGCVKALAEGAREGGLQF